MALQHTKGHEYFIGDSSNHEKPIIGVTILSDIVKWSIVKQGYDDN